MTDEAEALLPCPRCQQIPVWGGINFHNSNGEQQRHEAIRCLHCHYWFYVGDDPAETAKRWNARTPPCRDDVLGIDLERLSYTVANSKLGEGPSVRCEGPTEFEIDIARQWTRRVLAGISYIRALTTTPEPADESEPVTIRDSDVIGETIGYVAAKGHRLDSGHGKCVHCGTAAIDLYEDAMYGPVRDCAGASPTTGKIGELVERLRRTKTEHRVRPGFGGLVSFHDESETREVPVNPDGPEAADALTAMQADRDRLVEALTKYGTHERAWLIEGTHLSDVLGPMWWDVKHGFQHEVNRALRFARKEDAESFMREYRIKGTATEHEWPGALKTTPNTTGENP